MVFICCKQASFLLAQLALTDITYLKSIFLCRFKTLLRKLHCAATGNYYFKSDGEERRELTELAKCVHSTIFYTGKSKELCKELFFMCWYQIDTLYRPIHWFGDRYRGGKKIVLEQLYFTAHPATKKSHIWSFKMPM